MAIVQWDPTRDLSLLQGDMNRLFGRFLGEAQGSAGGAQRWVPAMDVTEADDHFVLHADLPGMDPDDVTIEVQERTLRIAGERCVGRRLDSSGGSARLERAFGRFERQLTLPAGVDADGIQASFDRGVLELRIPKPVAATPRRIQIGTPSATTSDDEHAVEAAESDRPAKRSIKDRVLANA
ncbi:MAG: Hsp20/alpha crystallin family protein [Thermoleophilia bacterium]|nr:Hsp20/alpha crystallin family protein [Thermoleophilia bacterium]